MPSYKGNQTRICHQGADGNMYVAILRGPEELEQWKEDSSKPLVDVVDSFQVFTTHRQGSTGRLSTASKVELENEFGTCNEDSIIRQLLSVGKVTPHQEHMPNKEF
ncbi:SBDS family protein Rtc3 [Schizosaccharomyces japonicus yFS275]|uniref:SBDS family protein Rtc3 n=1 Tax=Schizosaccharomyces japonicus (strain yFS275 / FY16936) TaxID=402676 RepID=B6JVS1_SCHJY|nr:SBDS family protein Rtc3 [Schizosaccharomyces japonicus yFS275]EEB05472.1 SBDS family protein Rtc3 [Schizosaccharomyces japonicus yFS275]